MANKIYWARFKLRSGWSKTWHKISAVSRNEALGKFIKGTTWNPSQVQITTKEPKR